MLWHFISCSCAGGAASDLSEIAKGTGGGTQAQMKSSGIVDSYLFIGFPQIICCQRAQLWSFSGAGEEEKLKLTYTVSNTHTHPHICTCATQCEEITKCSHSSSQVDLQVGKHAKSAPTLSLSSPSFFYVSPPFQSNQWKNGTMRNFHFQPAFKFKAWCNTCNTLPCRSGKCTPGLILPSQITLPSHHFIARIQIFLSVRLTAQWSVKSAICLRTAMNTKRHFPRLPQGLKHQQNEPNFLSFQKVPVQAFYSGLEKTNLSELLAFSGFLLLQHELKINPFSTYLKTETNRKDLWLWLGLKKGQSERKLLFRLQTVYFSCKLTNFLS